MSKAHGGSALGLQGGIILPVDCDDLYFPFYWNKVCGRGWEPISDVSTIVPDNRWGRVVAVECETTNLVNTSIGALGEIPVSNYYWWDFICDVADYITMETPLGFQQVAHTKWSVDPNKDPVNNGGGIRFGYAEVINVSPNTTYTFSYYIKVRDRDYFHPNFIYIREFNSSNTNIKSYGIASTSRREYVGNGWYRIWGTFTTDPNTVKVRIDHYAYDTNGNEVWFLAGQLEQKNWPTSFTKGTRGTGRIQYPKEMFPHGDFTLNMWICHTGDTRTNNSNYKLFALGTDRNTARLTLWNYYPISSDSLNRRIIADFGYDVGGNRQFRDLVSSDLFVPGNWEMFTVTFNYSTKEFRFYRNAKFWNSYIPTKLNPIESVEFYNSGWKYSNILISPRVASENEIKVWYDYGKHFYDPYDYYAIYG